MELDNEYINAEVEKNKTWKPTPKTETEELVAEARMRVEYEDHPDEWLELIEKLANKVEELDKKLAETVESLNKARTRASDQGWELDNLRQEHYQQRGRDGWL